MAALLALAAAGCGFTEVHEVMLRQPSGAKLRDPDIFMQGQTVPRPNYEMALVQVVGSGSEANLEDLMKALNGRGRALGCDAISKVTIDQGYSMAHAYGVCLKYATSTATTITTKTTTVSASVPKASPAAAAAPPRHAASPDDDDDDTTSF